jgi:hypothetical protein
MAYTDLFTTSFKQSTMIANAIQAADKNADLDTIKGGVCATITNLWIVKSLEQSSPEEGFKEITKNANSNPYWTQVCGAQKGLKEQVSNNNAVTQGANSREVQLQIFAGPNLGKKLSLAEKPKLDVAQIDKSTESSGPYYYLALNKCWGRRGGHAIGLFRTGGSYVLMDPNFGLGIDLVGLTPFSDLMTAMAAYYAPTDFTLYEVKQTA